MLDKGKALKVLAYSGGVGWGEGSVAGARRGSCGPYFVVLVLCTWDGRAAPGCGKNERVVVQALVCDPDVCFVANIPCLALGRSPA